MKPMTCEKCKRQNVFRVIKFDEALKLFILECPNCGFRAMTSDRQLKRYYSVTGKIASKLRNFLKELKVLIQRGFHVVSPRF